MTFVSFVPLAAAVLLAPITNAFTMFPSHAPNPVLQKFAELETGTQFKIILDVATQKDKDHRMILQDLVMGLSPDPAAKHSPALPGAQGPRPKLSTGAKLLNIKKDPYFIDSSGMRHLSLERGCWELVWRDDAPAGKLVCGFVNPVEAKRNGATFPKGRIYMSFPIWTHEGWQESLQRKEDVVMRAREYMKDKDDCIAKMNATPNPLMKALHYRNAAAALEKYWATNVNRLEQVPEEDEILQLHDDLLLTTKGTVWTKKDGFFGDNHVLLGTATASEHQYNKEDTKSTLLKP